MTFYKKKRTMEAFSGLRARNKENSKVFSESLETKCKDETLTVRLWAFISRIVTMKTKNRSHILVIALLSKFYCF